MIRFFYDMVVRAKQNHRVYWPYLYKVNKVLLNVIYPVVARRKRNMGISSEGKLIVSLTTYPGRIHQVWKTIASLLNQTMPPKKIILWLAEEQFPEKKLPENLLSLQKRGLEITWCEDLMSHKKYYEAFRQYPGEVVVTADDDILYPENFLEKLWNTHEVYPDAVVCHWSHRIGLDENGRFLPYNTWEDNGKEAPSYQTLAVGCNGILYPTAFRGLALDAEKIRQLAMRADDLWLKCMEIMSGTKTINCNDTFLIYFNVLSTRKSGLWVENTGEGNNNDVVWKRLMEEYPEARKRLLQEITG